MTNGRSACGERVGRRPRRGDVTWTALVLCAMGGLALAQAGCAGEIDGEDATGDIEADAIEADDGRDPEAVAEAEAALSHCPMAAYLCGHDGLDGPSTQLFHCSGPGATPKLVENCVGTCTIAKGANDRCPAIDGWSSVTKYRAPVSSVHESIVASVVAGSSPQSIIGMNATWLTDAAGGDGQRMRDALKDLHDWYQLQSPKPPLPLQTIPLALRNKMTAKLSPPHDAADTKALVERAVKLYKGSPPPTTDDGILAFFGIRAQCKEYADRTVKAGGGTPKLYTTAGVMPRAARQGMYAFLYKNGAPRHAAIILDVYWQGEVPIKLRLGESNWGTSWSRPPGQIPWSRTITRTREVPYSAYTVVDSL